MQLPNPTRPGTRRLRTAAVLALLAVGHLLAFLLTFALAFGIEDGGTAAPGWLNGVVAVLGSPLVTGLSSAPLWATAPLRSLLGAGNAPLFLIAGANSVIWAVAVRTLWRAGWRLARRPGTPAPAA